MEILDGQQYAAYALGGIQIERASGIRVWDTNGTEYLDGTSGTFNLILGHKHPEMVQALREAADELTFVSSTFQTTATNELMKELVDLSPSELTRVNLRSSGGSTANEGAIKIAQLVTGTSEVIVPFRAHLGQTLAMAGYGGFSRNRALFSAAKNRALNVPDPYCSRCFYKQEPGTCGQMCVDSIDEFLEYAGEGPAACMILEPISGVGGSIIPPAGYLPRLRQFCSDRGILLIFDENQTSFGRTGYMFAADAFEVTPDILTLSKSLSGAGVPLAAILMRESLAVLDRPMHGFTFGGGNLAATLALKTIEIIKRPGFLENVRIVGSFLKDQLTEMLAQYSEVFEVRGLGLMLGVELCDPSGGKSNQLTKAVQEALMCNGVITRVSEQGRGNTIELRPPLVLESDDAELLAERVRVSVSQCASRG